MLKSMMRYDWQRESVALDHPKLHFDFHFQKVGLPVPPHAHVLVAVSGGSDSMALLHLLHEWKMRTGASITLDVATVDHGLRKEAADEAQSVARVCKDLNVNHAILNWERVGDNKTSSNDARHARYRSLVKHAHEIGASCVCLGHTMDDQAETVLMRSLRGGAVRGLSGMSSNSLASYNASTVSLYRPLLAVRRQRLREWLQERNLAWVDDPSNESTASERVRLRRYLENNDAGMVANIASFATQAARHRAWLAREAAGFIEHHLRAEADGVFRFTPRRESVPTPIVADALAAAVQNMTGAAYRVPADKLFPIALAWNEREPLRFAIGGILLANSRAGLTLRHETRKATPAKTSSAKALQIIPSTDYPLHRALSGVSRST